MDQYKIEITQQGKENLTETIATLMEAAQEIANSAEKDFEKMKSKKWYKRLWELVTCSKDNQKITARGVTNLAKLTEIVMKAIVILANHSEETAEKVFDAMKDIENLEERFQELSTDFKKVVIELRKIKFNYKKNLSLDNLKPEERDILGTLFAKYARSCYENGLLPNEATKNLYAFAMEGDIIEEDINVSTHLDKLKSDVQKLLYRLNQSYYYLLCGRFDDSAYFDDFSVSVKDIKMIRQQIEEAVLLGGAENYAQTLVPDKTLYSVDAEGIEFIDEKDEAESVKVEEYSQCNQDDVDNQILENARSLVAETARSLRSAAESSLGDIKFNEVKKDVLDISDYNSKDFLGKFPVVEVDGNIASGVIECNCVVENNEVVSIFDYEMKKYLGDARITKITSGQTELKRTQKDCFCLLSLDISDTISEVPIDVVRLYKKVPSNSCKDDFNNSEDDFNTKKELFNKYIKDISSFSTSIEYDGYNKRVRKAISTFAPHIKEEEVIGFYDATVLSSGKSGYIFTTEGITFKDMGPAVTFKYEDIISMDKSWEVKDCNRTLTINLNNSKTVEITSLSLNKTPLYNLIEELMNV